MMIHYKLKMDVILCLFFLLFIAFNDFSYIISSAYLMIILIYLSLMLLAMSFRRYQQLLLVLLIITLVLAGILSLNYILFLIPTALFSLTLRSKDCLLTWHFFFFLIAISPIFLLTDWQLKLFYLLLTSITAIFYYILNQQEAWLHKNEETNESMRGQIYKLRSRLNLLEMNRMTETSLAKLEERNALSHRIHDQLGHSLTGGLIQLEACKTILQTNPDKALELLENAIQISQAGIEDIRKTLKATKPAQESLNITRLKNKLSQFEFEYKIHTVFDSHGALSKITQPLWYVLQQNLLEALTNIIKHTKASRVNVELSVYHKFIRLKIKDNGQNIATFTKSLGLIGMEERTAALGGNVLISAHKNGFEILTILPLSG